MGTSKQGVSLSYRPSHEVSPRTRLDQSRWCSRAGGCVCAGAACVSCCDAATGRGEHLNRPDPAFLFFFSTAQSIWSQVPSLVAKAHTTYLTIPLTGLRTARNPPFKKENAETRGEDLLTLFCRGGKGVGDAAAASSSSDGRLAQQREEGRRVRPRLGGGSCPSLSPPPKLFCAPPSHFFYFFFSPQPPRPPLLQLSRQPPPLPPPASSAVVGAEHHCPQYTHEITQWSGCVCTRTTARTMRKLRDTRACLCSRARPPARARRPNPPPPEKK